MLQLMAAWDSLAARLPPGTSSSASPEVLLQAIKLLLAHASPEDTARGLALASRLAELAGSGLPIDMDSIAAGVLVEAFPRGLPMSHDAVARRLGEPVAALVADLAKISRLPARIDLYDDAAAAALRELCLNFYDVRATAVEVVSRLHALEQGCSSGGSHSADCQVLALEALQLFAPMGHALGMSSVSSRLEDLCFGILFPASYRRTAEWLQHHAAAHRSMLEAAERALHAAVSELPQFAELAAGLEVHGRTKSPISTLKKVLRLGDMTKGGRTLREIYDLVGLRAIIVPRRDLPQAVAEDRALQACYLVESTAHAMWQPVEGRSKDYIASPKANGYQSLHSTIQLDAELLGMAGGEDAPRVRTLELQVRTEGQ